VTVARLAQQINVLARFCGRRDVEALDRLAEPADVLVLFGGSPLAGGDVLAEAVRRGTARHYMIVGGEGHTTDALRARVRAELPSLDPQHTAEADLFAAYLEHRHGLRVPLLERESTNCGSNVELCLRLLRERGVPHARLVLVQDATMQQRMDAGFRRWLGPEAEIVNFAAYAVDVVPDGDRLVYDRGVRGMWDLPHYVSLLLGEIPRLTDDEHGYGPNGRGFIAHVDVPDEVRRAFEEVRREFGAGAVRAADPRWGRPAGTDR
jgi:DUF218 domain-containing protein